MPLLISWSWFLTATICRCDIVGNSCSGNAVGLQIDIGKSFQYMLSNINDNFSELFSQKRGFLVKSGVAVFKLESIVARTV